MQIRRALALLCALLCLTVAGPGLAASDDLSEGLPTDPTERRKVLEARISAADIQAGDLGIEIEKSDKRMVALDAQIDDLDRQLGALDRQLAAIHVDLDRTTNAYISAEREVEGAARLFHDARSQVRKRAAQVYKSGPAMANFVFGARDLEDVDTRASYVKAVVEHDRAQVHALTGAEQTYQQKSSGLEALKAEEMASLNKVAAVQEEIEGSRASQDRIRRDVEAEAVLKRGVLAKVESDRATWQAMVARQQQESLGITDLLALYQGGQNVPAGVIHGMLDFPVLGEVSSVFGPRVHPIYGSTLMHYGLDLSVPYGVPIKAPAEGTVVYSGWMGGYGNAIVIDHGSQVATLHAHQAELLRQVGDRVNAGDTIGLVGSTGLSTGPHLHFEVRVAGEPTDPAPWMRG